LSLNISVSTRLKKPARYAILHRGARHWNEDNHFLLRRIGRSFPHTPFLYASGSTGAHIRQKASLSVLEGIMTTRLRLRAGNVIETHEHAGLVQRMLSWLICDEIFDGSPLAAHCQSFHSVNQRVEHFANFLLTKFRNELFNLVLNVSSNRSLKLAFFYFCIPPTRIRTIFLIVRLRREHAVTISAPPCNHQEMIR